MRLRATRVLVVEDTEAVRGAFSTLLAAEGAEVTEAATGRQALAHAASGRFDIVLTDLGLPDVPGDIVIREIRAAGEARPRIVAVTGYDEPYLSRARAAGADAVLMKPVEWSVLLRALRPAHIVSAVA